MYMHCYHVYGKGFVWREILEIKWVTIEENSGGQYPKCLRFGEVRKPEPGDIVVHKLCCRNWRYKLKYLGLDARLVDRHLLLFEVILPEKIFSGDTKR